MPSAWKPALCRPSAAAANATATAPDPTLTSQPHAGSCSMDFLVGTALIVLPAQHQVPLALATAAVKVNRPRTGVWSPYITLPT